MMVKGTGETSVNDGVKIGYAPVNGLNMYYEIHNSGNPMVLIHGGFGETGMFNDILPLLVQGRQVIAVDLQGHGRTADIDRPLSFEVMADDVSALIHHLGFERADVMGYSIGGSVALQTAIRHPGAVRKLVVVSAPCKSGGWYPEVQEGLKQIGPALVDQMKQTPMYHAYASIAPRPEDFPVLCTKTGDLHRRDYDWSQDVARIHAPALIVVGDADSVRPAHAAEFFELLGGGKRDAGWDGSGMSKSRLAVLPGLTHYNIFSSPSLAATVTAFLDAPMPATN